MKKIILSVAAVFAFGFANAQDNEGTGTKGFANGDVFITGAVGIGSVSFGDNKETSFEIAPSAGLFVTDNIAVGVRLGYTSDKAEVDGLGDTMDDTTLSVGAFGRYYATPSSDFSFFGELAFNYNSLEDKLADNKANGFDLVLAPGVSYFISDNFAFEATFGILGYETMKPDGADDSQNSFNFGLDMRDVRLGLVYKF